ncbi:MAG: GntR family transcriptional regulator [Spirochaetota bacterium]
MTVLNKHSYIPYYVQIKHILLDRIRNGIYAEQSTIPSEYKLAEEFSVTRMTVRKALEMLKREGAIQTERGKGSVVASKKIEQGLDHLYRFGIEVGDSGKPARSKTIEATVIDSTEDLATLFALPPREKFYRIVRLRMVTDDLPVSLETIFVPCFVAPDLLGELDDNQSLVKLLENGHGIPIAEATEYLTPQISDEYESRLLGIPNNSPIFQTERITRQEGGSVVEFRRSLIRGDTVVFRAELPR